jgi:hypothetical protein
MMAFLIKEHGTLGILAKLSRMPSKDAIYNPPQPLEEYEGCQECHVLWVYVRARARKAFHRQRHSQSVTTSLIGHFEVRRHIARQRPFPSAANRLVRFDADLFLGADKRSFRVPVSFRRFINFRRELWSALQHVG